MTISEAITILEALLGGDGWDSETRDALYKAVEVMGNADKDYMCNYCNDTGQYYGGVLIGYVNCPDCN